MGTEATAGQPQTVGMLLIEFQRQHEELPQKLPVEMQQLVWDAIVLSGETPTGPRPGRDWRR